MNFRLARMDELEKIENMFTAIIADMYEKDIKIWNEYYPNEEFEDDIKNERLYLVEDEGDIVAVTALVETTEGSDEFEWTDKEANAIYIARLGVNVKYEHRGYGRKLLEGCKATAKEKGKDCIRLFVVDCNKPAIAFYSRNEFDMLEGTFVEQINETTKLTQYAMEYKVK